MNRYVLGAVNFGRGLRPARHLFTTLLECHQAFEKQVSTLYMDLDKAGVNEFHTERLILRPLVGADAQELFAARGDEQVMEFWDAPPDQSPDETAAVVEFFLSDMRSGQSMYWTIRDRHDKSFVGICDLSEIRNAESADAGFMLIRRCWSLGLGGEVVRFLLSFAESVGIKLVTARIHSGNVRSRRLLMRAGFQIAGELHDYEIRPGVLRHCVRLEARLR